MAMVRGPSSISASILAAAFDALPEPAALVETSSAVLFTNAAWQKMAQHACATGPPEPAQTELLGDGLRRLWGVPEPTAAACQTACAELGQAESGERELAWKSSDSSASYRLILRSLGAAGILAVIKDVSAAEQLARALASAQSERDEALERLHCFSEITSETLVVSERGKILFVNAATSRMFGYPVEAVVGKSVLDFAAPEYHAEIIAHLSKSNSDAPYESTCVRADGTRFLAEVRGKVITYHGRPIRGAALLDITERRRVEVLLNQKLREEERARAQSDTLFALSTPLLPVSDEVLVVPLIGSLDSRRMARVMEVLLDGLVERRADFVIIDVTGMPTLDSATALGLVRAAQGVRLLGAQAILCGVRAEVAQELVRLGADLSGLLIRSTLKGAVAFALSHTRPGSARAAR